MQPITIFFITSGIAIALSLITFSARPICVKYTYRNGTKISVVDYKYYLRFLVVPATDTTRSSCLFTTKVENFKSMFVVIVALIVALLCLLVAISTLVCYWACFKPRKIYRGCNEFISSTGRSLCTKLCRKKDGDEIDPEDMPMMGLDPALGNAGGMNASRRRQLPKIPVLDAPGMSPMGAGMPPMGAGMPPMGAGMPPMGTPGVGSPVIPGIGAGTPPGTTSTTIVTSSNQPTGKNLIFC